jgi:hypothetical protein
MIFPHIPFHPVYISQRSFALICRSTLLKGEKPFPVTANTIQILLLILCIDLHPSVVGLHQGLPPKGFLSIKFHQITHPVNQSPHITSRFYWICYVINNGYSFPAINYRMAVNRVNLNTEPHMVTIKRNEERITSLENNSRLCSNSFHTLSLHWSTSIRSRLQFHYTHTHTHTHRHTHTGTHARACARTHTHTHTHISGI